MRKLAELFSGSPYTWAIVSTVLITLLYYGYSRTLPMDDKEINKGAAKVGAAAFLVNVALAWVVVSGMHEPISTVPFVEAPAPSAPAFDT